MYEVVTYLVLLAQQIKQISCCTFFLHKLPVLQEVDILLRIAHRISLECTYWQ